MRNIVLISYLKDNISISELAKISQFTYYWVRELVHDYEKNGLLTLTNKGRTKYIHLTDAGKKAVQATKEILIIIDKNVKK